MAGTLLRPVLCDWVLSARFMLGLLLGSLLLMPYFVNHIFQGSVVPPVWSGVWGIFPWPLAGNFDCHNDVENPPSTGGWLYLALFHFPQC